MRSATLIFAIRRTSRFLTEVEGEIDVLSALW